MSAAEVREAEARAHASHLVTGLASVSAAMDLVERDPALAAEGLEPIDQAAAIALVQDLRKRLGQVEMDLAIALGKAEGQHQGNLPDGRQFTLKRTAERKAWNHEDWKRDARRNIITRNLSDFGMGPQVEVILEGGEVGTLELSALLYAAVTEAQEVHGSTAPRSTALKRLGLYASDYCESSPGGWKFDAIAPSNTDTTTTKD